MSKMTVREFVTTWGFDIDDQKLVSMVAKMEGAKLVAESVEKALHFLEKPFELMFELADGAAHARIELEKTAQAVGLTAEKLRGLQFAAKMAHVDEGNLAVGLRVLSRNALNAAQGSDEAMKSFTRLGVHLHDSSGKLKSSDSILMEMADRFHSMPDGVEKTGLAVKLLGRSGSELIPLLNKGREELRAFSEEGKKFFVTDPAYLEKSERFGQAQVRVNAALGHMKNTIGVAVMPELARLMNRLVDWYLANKKIIDQDLQGLLTGFLPPLKMAAGLFMSLAYAAHMVAVMLGGTQNAVHLLMAAFAGLAVMGIIANFGKIMEGVQMLTAAIRSLFVAESMASGGLNLLFGAGAAVGAYGLLKAADATMAPANPMAGTTQNTYHFHTHADVRATGVGAEHIGRVAAEANKKMLQEVAANIVPAQVR